jgi:hypothetical protein
MDEKSRRTEGQIKEFLKRSLPRWGKVPELAAISRARITREDSTVTGDEAN